MSDAGGTADLNLPHLTFDQSSLVTILNEGPLTETRYRPANWSDPGDSPEILHPTDLSVYRGIHPGGDWKLYVVDDSAGNIGSIAGWTLILQYTGFQGCTGIPYSSADVEWAARIAAGLTAANDECLDRLDAVRTGDSNGRIDNLDVLRLARRVAGLDP